MKNYNQVLKHINILNKCVGVAVCVLLQNIFYIANFPTDNKIQCSYTFESLLNIMHDAVQEKHFFKISSKA